MSPEKPSSALFTDLYELTMAQAYWQAGKTAQATFSLFFRGYPAHRSYYVSAGLADVLEHLESFRLSGTDMASLRSLNRFDTDFLDYLGGLRFTGSVRAMPEGTILFADEPVIEVTAPVIEGQVVETYLLNQVSLQSTLATKAARVVAVSRGKSIVDFGARRAHGTEAADRLARVSYMVGFDGTSNVGAGARYGIPVYGTMAHSWVQTFEDEIDAFRAYAKSFPASSTFLVDTYDTIGGTRKAIDVALQMRQSGHALQAVRLDSGDLLDLSLTTRAMLDEAGLQDVQIFASGGLDEYAVDELLSTGAAIDGFGVGTRVGVSADAPAVDSVYKLVEYDRRPVLKLSTDKATAPGRKQVYRVRDAKGRYMRDVIARADEGPPVEDAEPLLRDVMAAGRAPGQPPTLSELRKGFEQEFRCLPERYRDLKSPEQYEVVTSDSLRALQSEIAAKVGKRGPA